MIHIDSKKDCCGCSACSQRCPKACISMQPDAEGFLYPQIESELCIDCGLCDQVCPVLNQAVPRSPEKVYAAVNKNFEHRVESSSGGIFSCIAKGVIENGGVVFGARFDSNWNVVHTSINSIDSIDLLRGSKYVQSNIGSSYREAEFFLKQNIPVLFSGTPCQIRGLKLFLRKDYDNLITIDFICHGVPSPNFWKKYVQEVISDHNIESLSHISKINFRNKDISWAKFQIKFDYWLNGRTKSFSTIHYNDPYFYCFLNHVSERYSCYDCPSKEFKSRSDITLADFWGGKPSSRISDLKDGVSLIFLHSDKCSPFLTECILEPVNWSVIHGQNPMAFCSIKPNKIRGKFYKTLESGSIKQIYYKLLIKNTIKKYANRLINIASRNRLR